MDQSVRVERRQRWCHTATGLASGIIVGATGQWGRDGRLQATASTGVENPVERASPSVAQSLGFPRFEASAGPVPGLPGLAWGPCAWASNLPTSQGLWRLLTAQSSPPGGTAARLAFGAGYRPPLRSTKTPI